MFLFSQKRTMTDEEKILEYLSKDISGCEIKGDSIYLLKYHLTIKPLIENIIDDEVAKTVDLKFIMNHEIIKESISELVTGIGETLEEAFHMCVKNFLAGPFYCIKNSMIGKYDERFETSFVGRRKIWSLFKGLINGLQSEEAKQNIRIWNIIGEKVKDRLSNKKVYLIKVDIIRYSTGEIDTKCFINGILNNEISSDILEYSKAIEIYLNSYSLKQYFIIRQDDKTYEECEISEEVVKEFTKRAINVLGNQNKDEFEEKFRILDNDIYKITGNHSLAFEIMNFVPEILCELVFSNVNYTDEISIIKEDREKSFVCYKNQFTSYYSIYQEVLYNFFENKISEEEIRTIVLLSSSYKSINNALNNRMNIQNLKNVGITLYAYNEYIPT